MFLSPLGLEMIAEVPSDPSAADPVDGVVADRDVQPAAHERGAVPVATAELDAVGVRGRGVVQVVDVGVLDGDALVGVEPVLTAVDVGPLHRHHRLAHRGARGVLAVDLDVLEQQRGAADVTVVHADAQARESREGAPLRSRYRRCAPALRTRHAAESRRASVSALQAKLIAARVSEKPPNEPEDTPIAKSGRPGGRALASGGARSRQGARTRFRGLRYREDLRGRKVGR